MTKAWIPVIAALPTKKDADEFDRVWAVAIDATGRHHPTEAYYKHVRRLADQVYTHWMWPEWGANIKRKRR